SGSWRACVDRSRWYMSAAEGADFETVPAIPHIAPAARCVGRSVDEGEAALRIGAQLQSWPIRRVEKQRERECHAQAEHAFVWGLRLKAQEWPRTIGVNEGEVAHGSRQRGLQRTEVGIG